ncbi:ATP-binding cassette domain-containing protein, partial [Pseudomonas aeruginosa]|nr:ATP-binding cassette domain-containing protein [Pseudomonas aeruginosa]
IQRLKIKTSSPELAIGRLSGGNQQKAILARCLLLNPRILILDEPTRGIDIGAKYEIYKLINQLVQQGIAVIVISSELPEVLGLSDRVLVMHEGRLKANLVNQHLTQEQVMEAALRSERHVEEH